MCIGKQVLYNQSKANVHIKIRRVDQVVDKIKVLKPVLTNPVNYRTFSTNQLKHRLMTFTSSPVIYCASFDTGN